MIFNLQNFVISLVLAIIIGAGAAWLIQGLRISTINANHKAEVAEMTTRVAIAEGESSKLKLTFETSLKEKKNELDKEYAERTAHIDDAVSKLAGIRLRDPSAGGGTGSSGNQGSTEGSNGSDSANTGLLSPQASQFLWSFAGESQLYLDRLNQCKVWNAELTSQTKIYYNQIQDLKKKIK